MRTLMRYPDSVDLQTHRNAEAIYTEEEVPLRTKSMKTGQVNVLGGSVKAASEGWGGDWESH